MKNLKDQGFYVEWTGGNCSAWVKKLPTGQYVVITCAGGCDHRIERDALVGIYDGSENEGMWGDLIQSFEIELTSEVTE
jgi:hypothetical protein